MGLETWRGIVTLLSFITPIMVMALLFWLQKYFIQRGPYEKQQQDEKEAREKEKQDAQTQFRETRKRVDEIIAELATNLQTAVGKITFMEFSMTEYNKQCRDLTSEQGQLEGQMRSAMDAQNQSDRRTQEQISQLRIELERVKTMLDERLPRRKDG